MLREAIPRSDGAPSSRTARATAGASMRVRRADGSSEPVDVDRLARAVNRCCVGLADVHALRVASKTVSGLYDGATTRELDQRAIQTAASLIVEEPQYGRLAARLLARYIEKEVRNQDIHAFSDSVTAGHRLGLVNDRLQTFVASERREPPHPPPRSWALPDAAADGVPEVLRDVSGRDQEHLDRRGGRSRHRPG
jgi:ribonucleoside-diphosphate reductase alpha chain